MAGRHWPAGQWSPAFAATAQRRRKLGTEPRDMSMDEFGGGFLRSLLIGFGLAVGVSFLYVWFK